jgi:hypothetical protein
LQVEFSLPLDFAGRRTLDHDHDHLASAKIKAASLLITSYSFVYQSFYTYLLDYCVNPIYFDSFSDFNLLNFLNNFKPKLILIDLFINLF